ncbi:hypothetical protein AB0N16_28585 [Streptomyces sp. NPDC051105]|uniref:hypothetical protein n=1 Tax=Streptomyces sp. NPDC051105 TaxID=3154843 RepID=UPI003432D71D
MASEERVDEDDVGAGEAGAAELALPGDEGRLVGRRIGRIGHPQVAAQHVDTGLTLLAPLVGEPGHGIRTRHPGRWLIRPELIGCGPEPVGEGPAMLTLLTHLIEVLAPVADDQSHDTAVPATTANAILMPS